MENLLKPYDKEYMRMAMLKHEEIFKHQVYELHRLYRIQKTLMKIIESKHGNVSVHSRTRLDLEHPAAETDHQGSYNVSEPDHGRNTMLEAIDESEIELTLGHASYLPRKKHGTPLTSDSGPSFSSSSTESSHVKKTSRTREDFNVNGITFGYQNESNNNNDLEEHSRQPPWLFQVLSMNMT